MNIDRIIKLAIEAKLLHESETKEYITECGVEVWISGQWGLDAMTKGKGTIQDWRTLVDVLNLAQMFAWQGIGPEVLPVCEQAQEGLHKAALRYQETKKMGLDGMTIVHLRHLIEYADLQQASVPRSEFERLVMKTKNYIRGNGNRVVEIA